MLVVMIGFFVLACGVVNERKTSVLKEVVPKGSRKIELVTSPIQESSDAVPLFESNELSESESELHSLIPRGYSILETKWENLDSDDLEEAIVSVYQKDRELVSVFIVKFDVSSEKYVFVWEGKSELSSNNIIQVTIKDFNFDGKKEIVLEGSNVNQEQHIEVFTLRSGLSNLRSYYQIFSLSAKGGGAIEVLESLNGLEPRIIAYNYFEDKEIIEKIDYKWNNIEGKFLQAGYQKLSYADVAQQKISSLDTQNPIVWQNFLNGVWEKKSDLEASQTVFLYFSSRSPHLSIIDSDSMKFYMWEKTRKDFRFNLGIKVNVTDLILPNIRSVLNIEVVSEKEIVVNFKDDYDKRLSGDFVLQQGDYADFLSVLNTQRHRNKRVSKLKSWLLGKKQKQFSTESYFFTEDALSVFTEEGETLFEYSIFPVRNEMFLELRKKKEKAFFYRVSNADQSAFIETGELVLEPYTLTAIENYLLNQDESFILIKPDDG